MRSSRPAWTAVVARSRGAGSRRHAPHPPQDPPGDGRVPRILPLCVGNAEDPASEALRTLGPCRRILIRSPPARPPSAPPLLDEVDRALVQALVDDGRISNAALARRVGIAESTCVGRVRALRERGVITGVPCRASTTPCWGGRSRPSSPSAWQATTAPRSRRSATRWRRCPGVLVGVQHQRRRRLPRPPQRRVARPAARLRARQHLEPAGGVPRPDLARLPRPRWPRRRLSPEAGRTAYPAYAARRPPGREAASWTDCGDGVSLGCCRPRPRAGSSWSAGPA